MFSRAMSLQTLKEISTKLGVPPERIIMNIANNHAYDYYPHITPRMTAKLVRSCGSAPCPHALPAYVSKTAELCLRRYHVVGVRDLPTRQRGVPGTVQLTLGESAP